MAVMDIPFETAEFVPPTPDRQDRPMDNLVWLRSIQALPALLRNPIEAFYSEAYRDPVVFTQLFHQRLAIVNEPGFIRHIFTDDADALAAEPARQAVLKPVLEEGMLTAEGAKWRKARRALAPVFAPRHVHGFAETMQTVTKDYVAALKQGGTTVLAAEEMTKLAYNILSATLFSGDLDDESDAMIADVAYVLEHLSHPDPLDFLNAPQWLPRLTKIRGRKAVKRLRSAFRRTAEARKLKIERGEQVPEDFLTLLLKTGEREKDRLTLDEIEDNIITFIAAGHETTARAMAWMLYLLSFDPNARQRCEEEADALDMDTIPPHQWGEKLPWITACFEEAMRLFPPAAIVSRRIVKDIHYKDHHLTPGMNLIVSQWVLHRHETLWDDPNIFRPQRFFGENRSDIHRYAYLPFGLGKRVCIGASFAMQEAMIMAAYLLKNFQFDYEPETLPKPIMKITVQPDNGIPMKVTAR